MRISVTIQADRERSRRIEANLYKVVEVICVKTEQGIKEVLGESFDDEPRAT